MKLRRVARVLLLVCFTSAAVHAQSVQTGTIRGTVTDPTGAAINDAEIAITSPALQGPRSAMTAGGDGSYVLPLLPPGKYRASYQKTGFKTAFVEIEVPLATAIQQDVVLFPLTSSIVEVVEPAPPLARTIVGLNIGQREVESLATPRTLQGIATLSPGVNENTPNARQLSINGSLAFDNIMMIDGIDIDDNVIGQPQNAFIEDAIEEVRVLTSGIPAEYGRFTGGVVNAISKSGGNNFSGSFRVNLSNPSWTSETPLERSRGIERLSTMNESYEATAGGPIATDRLWFFGAWRLANLSTTETLSFSGIPYNKHDDNWRLEGKVTGSVGRNQTVQVGALTNPRKQRNNPALSVAIHPSTLDDQDTPNHYVFGAYRGAFRTSLLAEAQYSDRRWSIKKRGGTSTAIADSPFLFPTPPNFEAFYNAPYFDERDPEERNNRQLTASVTHFAGQHEIKGGYEWFRSQQITGNSPSSTGYVFYTDYVKNSVTSAPILDGQGRVVPLFEPGATEVDIVFATSGATLDIDTNSLYAQDHWRIAPRLSADLGVRYEHAGSRATGDVTAIGTSTWMPRLAVSYDVRKSGGIVASASYSHYAGRYLEAQVGRNSSVANPDVVFAFYRGPQGQGIDFAPGTNPANYQPYGGSFPTANVSIEDGLSSPVTKEFALSIDLARGSRASGSASYIWRRTSGFIDDEIVAGNGITTVTRDGVDLQEATNVVYRNSEDLERRYQALAFQGRYRLTSHWDVRGNWTIQLRNHGNYEGEATNQPGVRSFLGNFPEAFDPDRISPDGRLANFQRHRARLWSIYSLDPGGKGTLSFSGLVRFESGRPYSSVIRDYPITDTQAALLSAYPDPPLSQDLFFGERGAQTFPSYALLDVSANYDVPVFRALRPWVKVDLFNLLNNDKLVGYSTTIVPVPDGPVDSLGLPTTFQNASSFGSPRGTNDYPRSLAENGGRTLRISFGLRF